MKTTSLMEKLIIEYKGFILTEPNMLLSNWVITLVCLWCVQQLKTMPASPLISYYRLVLTMNAMGAFLGGLAHLFFHYTGKPFQAFAWIFVGIGTYYLQRIALIFITRTNLKKPLLTFSTGKLILFILALLYFQSFFVVLADLALGLFIMVVPIHIKYYAITKNKGSMWMLVAVALLVVSAIFPVFRISIHPLWFNFNDIGHIFLAVSLFIIYLSARYLIVAAELKR
jgi:hypothetical protein